MPRGRPESVPDDGLTTRQRRNRPLVIVHTGQGKGKSTAAFGMALRAWSAGWPIAVYQFVKSPKWKVGEETALRALGETGQGGSVVWHKMGEGWSWIQRPGTERDHAAEAACARMAGRSWWGAANGVIASSASTASAASDVYKRQAMTTAGAAGSVVTTRCPAGPSGRRPSDA